MIFHPIDQFLARNVGFRGGLGEPLIVVTVGSEQLDIAAPVAAIDVDQRGIELERRHCDHDFGIIIGRLHGLQSAQFRQRGAEAHPRWQERQAKGSRLEAPLKHAFIEFEHFDLPGLARLAEPWFERNRVERDERKHQFAHLTRHAEHADIGPAIGHQRQVLEIGAQDFAHQGHRLAAWPPAADAQRHPVMQLGDNLGGVHPLVEHRRRGHAASPWLAAVIASCQAQTWPHSLGARCAVGVQVAGSITSGSQPISMSNPPGVCI